VRTVPGSDFLDRAQELAPRAGEGDGSIELLARSEPDRFPALAGFASGPVPFGSDAPRLRALVPDRTVVLAGPGSVLLAHSAGAPTPAAGLPAGLDLTLRPAARLLGLDEPHAQPRAAAALEGRA